MSRRARGTDNRQRWRPKRCVEPRREQAGNKPTHTHVAHACRMTYQPARGAMSRQNPRRRTPVYILSLRRFKGEGPTREHGEPARKTTEKRNKAEAGKKCMTERRVEERVKGNGATKGTRGSQRPSKERAQGRVHGRHTASTTPHRDTGEGSTRGTREERHHAPRHARHKLHTHRTHPTSPATRPVGGRSGEG